MTKPIDQLNQPPHVLTQKARALTQQEITSAETRALVAEMIEVMRAAPGVGLAAPQIGVSLQVVVIEDDVAKLNVPQKVLDDRKRSAVPLHVLFNPTILELSGNIEQFFEGCLSVRGKARVTSRYEYATVQYWDEHGVEKIVKASGWYARILQHEIDHLNGRLYVDIADPRTELEVNDEFRARWFAATRDEIAGFVKECEKPRTSRV